MMRAPLARGLLFPSVFSCPPVLSCFVDVSFCSFLERVSSPFPRRAHFEARPTERAMGNALSGSERWPVRHERAEQFAAMAEGETMTVGAGCYWGTEKWYAKHFGEDWKRNGAVLATAVGFMGPKGTKPHPTYREVCSGKTGHVEVCQIRYDSSKTTYEDLVSHLFTFHDPTTLNRQGNDSGSQYASVIFAHDETQRETAEKVVRKVQGALDAGTIKAYAGGTVATRVEDATTFYPAHEAHQKYLEKKPEGYCNHRRRFRWEDVFVNARD